MTWNNRIFKHEGEHGASYALHEAFYDNREKPHSWTKEPMCGHFESVDELIESLECMLNDAKRFKDAVLNYIEEPPDYPDA